MESFTSPPQLSDFKPLDEHLSQTPESFFPTKPILFYHTQSATLTISNTDLECTPLLKTLSYLSSNGAQSRDAEQDREITIPNVEIWVTSADLILYSPTRAHGVRIPYPTITLHAIQPPTTPIAAPSLYLQLLKQRQPYDDHDPESTISLTLLPAPSPSPSSESSAQLLFVALTECANLHPDPTSDSDSEAANGPIIGFEGDAEDFQAMHAYSSCVALPPPMPGSGGWITAENVAEFYHEDGTPRGDGEGFHATEQGEGGVLSLGTGAGSLRRGRDDRTEEGDAEETKWRRTE